MNSLGILLINFALFLLSCGEKYELIPVESIIKIPGDEKVPHLRENTDAASAKFDREERLKICWKGLKLIQDSKYKIKMGSFESDTIETINTYGIVKPQTGEEKRSVELVSCYKCTNNPAICVQIKSDFKNDELIFFIIFKMDRPPSRLEEIVGYEIEKVDEISAAEVSNILLIPEGGDGFIVSSYDTDILPEEARFLICKNTVETVLAAEGERIDVKYLKDITIRASKYYSVVIRGLHRMEPVIMKVYDCPTKPNIKINVVHKEEGFVVWALINRCDFKRRAISFTPDLMIETLGRSPTTAPREVVEGLNTVNLCTLSDYIQTRERSKIDKKHDHSQKLQEDTEVKHRICTSIASSQMYTQFSTVPIEEPSATLLARYPDVFEKRSRIPSRFGTEYIPSHSTATLAVYVSRDHYADQEAHRNRIAALLQEEVFMCPCLQTLNDETEKIEKHFISKEYNMNYASDSSNNYIAGRFIFKLGPHELIFIHGVAEEPARPVLVPDSNHKNVELLYLQRSSKYQPAKEESSDPICKLSKIQKSRLCELIFHSEYYLNYIRSKFPETQKITSFHECYKRTIAFRNEDVKAMTNGDEYQEWMTICFLSGGSYVNPTLTSRTFYLSRAYDDSDPDALTANDVFVYRRELDGGYYLQQSFTDVRLEY